MATMLDVSIRAGVSKATVSRVLNGTGQVKESTRQQVFKAMEELGYRPNFLARSLANQTSNSIGLVVSTFDGFYFGRLLQQASRQTEAWGKQLIVTDGHDTPEREEEAVQMLADRQCDAIILYTRHMSEKAIMSLINSIAMPLVVINRDVAQARERCVFFEQQEAAFQAVEYLITQGHRDIACITVPMHTPTGQARLQGYRNALIKHGIEWDPSRVKYGDSTMTRGYELCRELLDEKARFSALFSCNDDMALGGVKGAASGGAAYSTGCVAVWLRRCAKREMAGAGAVDGLSAHRQHDHYGYRPGDQACQSAADRNDPAVYRHAGASRVGDDGTFLNKL